MRKKKPTHLYCDDKYIGHLQRYKGKDARQLFEEFGVVTYETEDIDIINDAINTINKVLNKYNKIRRIDR
ncbi:MAG TPA: hypothetical protein DDX29_01240 [Clostridiales bacterium]|nr:hypothetical protein [Clostridiales bacterium]